MAGAARMTGQWKKAMQILTSAPTRIPPALRKAIMQEAHFLRAKMIEGLKSGSPGGQTLVPNSPLTIAKKGSSKPLIDSGAMMRSIAVHATSGGAFVGIKRGAVGKGGKDTVNLAMLHEKGAVITMRMTQRQRRFLFVMLSKHGSSATTSAGSGGGMLRIRIPARPFITPVLDMYAKPADVKHRVAVRFAQFMNGDLGRG